MVDGIFTDGGLERQKTEPLEITGGKPLIIDYRIQDVSVLDSKQDGKGKYLHGLVIYSIKPTGGTSFCPAYEEKAQGDWVVDMQMEVILYYENVSDFWYLVAKDGELNLLEAIRYFEQ